MECQTCVEERDSSSKWVCSSCCGREYAFRRAAISRVWKLKVEAEKNVTRLIKVLASQRQKAATHGADVHSAVPVSGPVSSSASVASEMQHAKLEALRLSLAREKADLKIEQANVRASKQCSLRVFPRPFRFYSPKPYVVSFCLYTNTIQY
jgi:hypothetical protein